MNELKKFYDEVAKVAHDFYEKRGKVHGYDLEDWLTAETLVKKRYEKEGSHEPGAGKKTGRKANKQK